MKKCLITGGAGFIGSHLSEYLLKTGNEVKVIDDLSTGSIENISHLKKESSFSYIIDNCSNKNLMAELIDEADEVYHLAAAVGVKLIVDNPEKTIDLNYSLTKIALEMAEKKNKPVFFTSTSEVYGKSTDLPFSEEGNLLLGSSTRWRWSYACSKLLDEFMVLANYRISKTPVVIARLFNTVGPRQTGQYGMVVPTFIRQALKNEPITVYGDGTQSRCFCHVSDSVPVFPALLRNQKAHGNIFNIGSNLEISIKQLAEKIKKQLNSTSEIIHIPYEQAYNEGFEDMKRRVPSIEKVNALTGFKPARDLETIISDVAELISKRQG